MITLTEGTLVREAGSPSLYFMEFRNEGWVRLGILYRESGESPESLATRNNLAYHNTPSFPSLLLEEDRFVRDFQVMVNGTWTMICDLVNNPA